MTDDNKNIYCLKCRKNVLENQNSIFCDVCENWIHLRCSGLNRTTVLELSQTDESFFCGDCLKDTFPFANIKDYKFANLFDIRLSRKAVCQYTDIAAGYGKICSVCFKASRTSMSSVPCSQCQHLIHKNALRYRIGILLILNHI